MDQLGRRKQKIDKVEGGFDDLGLSSISAAGRGHSPDWHAPPECPTLWGKGGVYG
jgi:hypothetical protein